jgi:dTDP-L-rhamnose 4-epimerase
VYALSKFDQERMCLMTGRAYNIPTVALRFFNAYGPRQALSNPYTGVLAIFAARLLNDSPPKIFEDGLQQRDFVSVYDIARACRLALETPAAAGEVFNIGSGEAAACAKSRKLAQGRRQGSTSRPRSSASTASATSATAMPTSPRRSKVLGYTPQVTLEDGLAELPPGSPGQAAVDRVAQASAELSARGAI